MLLVLIVVRTLPKLLPRGTGSIFPWGGAANCTSGFQMGLLFVSNPARVVSYQVAMPMVHRRADPSGPKEIHPRAALLHAGNVSVKRSPLGVNSQSSLMANQYVLLSHKQ